jgi:hypothetical protein
MAGTEAARSSLVFIRCVHVIGMIDGVVASDLWLPFIFFCLARLPPLHNNYGFRARIARTTRPPMRGCLFLIDGTRGAAEGGILQGVAVS